MAPTGKDSREEFKRVERQAKLGKRDAQFLLCYMYRIGYGVDRDNDEAAYWCFKALRNGHPKAERRLVQLYREGLGFKQEDPDAARWWFKYELRAANQGSALAQCNVGRMYREGRGVQRDLAKAAEWYVRAAKQGRPKAGIGLLRIVLDVALSKVRPYLPFGRPTRV